MKFPFDEKLLEFVLEDSHSFLGIFDANLHRFTYLNKMGLEMLAVADLDEFNFKYSDGFIKDKFIDEKLEKIRENHADHSIYSEEIQFSSWSGNKYWGIFQISYFTLKDKPSYFIRIIDITSQKNSEMLLRNEKNRFEALFKHAAIGIVMVDKVGEIVLSNRFADTLFGYNEGELIGKNLDVLIPDNLKQRHRNTHNEFVENPQIRTMGLGLYLNGKRKDSSLFPVEISLSFFNSGDVPYFISFINDISYKKKAEFDLINKNSEIEKLNNSLEREVVNRTNALVETLKSLEKSKAELEIALSKEKDLGELKSRFVSMASHEFRTPLTAIQSAASLIEKYPLTEEQEKRERHTSRIKAAVNNLTDILEEFLSVGKLEEGKIEAKSQIFNLYDLVQEALADLRGLIKPGQKLNYKHFGENLLTLDRSFLRKIILNLCSNAIKFSPSDAEIKIITEVDDNKLVLTVKDQGIGISKEDQKHLFDRFFRGTNVTHIQGTGLGLHIVSQYAELLNGKVEVQSELDKGTTFKVTINLMN
jgi:PAS domain S-box-containing protein